MTGYFPATKWYSIWDHSVVDASSGGIYQRLDAPLGDIPAHVWGPSVLPMQDFAMTTTAARKTPLSFLAAMPADLVSLVLWGHARAGTVRLLWNGQAQLLYGGCAEDRIGRSGSAGAQTWPPAYSLLKYAIWAAGWGEAPLSLRLSAALGPATAA